jgi:hypothetical protein
MVVPGSSFSQPLRLLPPLCCVNQTSALSIALLPSCITRISASSAQQAPTIMSFFTTPSSFFFVLSLLQLPPLTPFPPLHVLVSALASAATATAIQGQRIGIWLANLSRLNGFRFSSLLLLIHGHSLLQNLSSHLTARTEELPSFRPCLTSLWTIPFPMQCHATNTLGLSFKATEIFFF